MMALLLRREADALSRAPSIHTPDHVNDRLRRTAVVLRNIAGVVEVHGLPGLLGYIACMRFSHSVEDQVRNAVIDVVDRILRGEAH